jgi:genome maintenance exonuclease 1|tara:strand:- start:67 stop:744 length:678 start_codon:yes stop_codon:yes gene_type:complete
MNIVEKYDYPSLKRTDSNKTRLYKTPDGDFPSVTTILDKTKDKTFLFEWRKRVGDEEANRISKEAAGLGTVFHKHLENYINNDERPSGSNFVYKLAKDMSDIVIEKGLSNVDEVWGSEIGLYYPGLYAGTTDLVGTHKGEPAIIDYKSTKSPKKEEWVEDYYLQCCAYALAHNELFKTKINKAVILMCSRKLQFQEFIIEGEKFEEYSEKWTKRLEEFYKYETNQ